MKDVLRSYLCRCWNLFRDRDRRVLIPVPVVVPVVPVVVVVVVVVSAPPVSRDGRDLPRVPG